MEYVLHGDAVLSSGALREEQPEFQYFPGNFLLEFLFCNCLFVFSIQVLWLITTNKK